MPIMVTYDDLEALGPLALQAGYQGSYGQSYTSGREGQLDRRSQDQRFLLGNTFENQRMGMQQNFQANQAGLSRDFQAGQAANAQNAQMQELQLRLAADKERNATDFNQRVALDQLQSGLTADRQTQENVLKSNLDIKEQQAKLKAEHDQYVSAAASQGIPPEEASKQYSQIILDRMSKSGNFAPGRGQGGHGDSLLGTLSGGEVQGAILALDSAMGGVPGAASTHLARATADSSKLFDPADKANVRDTALNAMYAAARSPGRYTPQQLLQAIMHEPDPDVQARLKAALQEKIQAGSQPSNAPVRPGAAPTTGGPGVGVGGGAPVSVKPVDQMTTEEILRELGSGH